MSGEINVLSRQQTIIVEPTSGTVSVINAGFGGGSSLPGGGDPGDILTKLDPAGVGWLPPVIHHRVQGIFDLTDLTVAYVGQSEPGALPADAAWTVLQAFLDPTNGDVVSWGWSEPDQVWDDRTTLIYT